MEYKKQNLEKYIKIVLGLIYISIAVIVFFNIFKYFALEGMEMLENLINKKMNEINFEGWEMLNEKWN